MPPKKTTSTTTPAANTNTSTSNTNTPAAHTPTPAAHTPAPAANTSASAANTTTTHAAAPPPNPPPPPTQQTPQPVPPNRAGGFQSLEPAQPAPAPGQPWPAANRPAPPPQNPGDSRPLTQPVVPDANNDHANRQTSDHYMTRDLQGQPQDVYIPPTNRTYNQGAQMQAGVVQNTAAASGQLGTDGSKVTAANHDTRNDPNAPANARPVPQVPGDMHTGGEFGNVQQPGQANPPQGYAVQSSGHAYDQSHQVGPNPRNQVPDAVTGANDVTQPNTRANVEAWPIASRDGQASGAPPITTNNQVIPTDTRTAANPNLPAPQGQTQTQTPAPAPQEYEPAPIPKTNPWGTKPSGGSGKEAVTDDAEGADSDDEQNNGENPVEGVEHEAVDDQEGYEHDQEQHPSEDQYEEHVPEHHHEEHSLESHHEHHSSEEHHHEWNEHDHGHEHQHGHGHGGEGEHEHEHEHHGHEFDHEDNAEHGDAQEGEDEFGEEEEEDYEHEHEYENEEGEEDEQDEESHHHQLHSHLSHIKEKIHDFIHEREIGQDDEEGDDDIHHRYEHGYAQEVY